MPQTHINPELPNIQEIEEAEIMLASDDELSEEEKEDIKEELKNLRAKYDDGLADLGSSLETKFQGYATRRGTKENEWVNAILQFQGFPETGVDKSKIEGYKYFYSDKPKSNITRPKVEQAIARMQDIQFPLGGDSNFHLRPRPDPLMEESVDDPQPMEDGGVTRGQVAQAALDHEADKAYNMEVKIEGQLADTGFGRESRQSMRDWAILGTAIIKGPVVQQKSIRNYENYGDSEGGLQSALVKNFEDYPASIRTDPRFFYPDPDAILPQDVEDAFEVHTMNKKKLRELSDSDAFMKEQIRAVLLNEPDGLHGRGITNLANLLDTEANLKSRYLVKEYHGCLDKKILAMMGEIPESEVDDPLVEYYGEVWFCQGIVIRVSVSVIEGEDKIPYNIVVWSQDDGSLFGHGMPYMMKDQARVITSTWRMLLDNASLSAGPQIAINKEMIEPANGEWALEPMKVWFNTEYGEVRSAISFVDVPNNQNELQAVIDMAMQFADIESSSPYIQQNTVPQGNNTASGLGLVLTEANVYQRELSQAWDDYITVPLITDYYHYNMQYSSDPSIKGDFEVDLGGATERIDNQILAQDIEKVLGLAMQNEEFLMHIDPGEAFRKLVIATRAGGDVLRSSSEVEAKKQEMQQAAQQQGPDPDQIKAQTEMAKAELEQQKFQHEVEKGRADSEREDYNSQIKQQLQASEINARIIEKQLELRSAMAKIASEENRTIAEIEKDLAINEIQEETKRLVKAADIEKFNEEVALKNRYGTGI